MEIDLQFGCERAIGLEREVVRLGGEMFEQCLAIKLHHIAHLGGKHIIGALRGGIANQPCRLLKTWLGQQPGAHLQHGGAAIAAARTGVDFDGGSHLVLCWVRIPDYMGALWVSTTRANTRTSTDAALARNSARAQASAVAPEVRTSSIRTTRRP